VGRILEAGNAESRHVPCSGNFVPERGTGTSGDGVPKWYGTSIRCCRNLKTVRRRFKPGIPQSMPQGRQLLAASTAAKGSGLRRRDSTRQLALRLALVPRPLPVRHRRLAACRRRCPRRRSRAGGNRAPRDGSTRSAARPRPWPARPWRVSFASAAAAAMEFDSVGPSSFGVRTADG
jgi:hypothetical protein